MVYIINFGSSKVPAIVNTLNSLRYDSTVVDWNEPNLNFNNATAYILSGAPVLLTEVPATPYLKKLEFIKSTAVPVLGICFGHQLIGMLYGAKVYLGQEIDESVNIKFMGKDRLFDRLTKQAIFEEDHTEGINLPKGFLHLAYSVNYQIEAIKHPTKKIYGVQFHPEISGHNGKILMHNFLNLIPIII